MAASGLQDPLGTPPRRQLLCAQEWPVLTRLKPELSGPPRGEVRVGSRGTGGCPLPLSRGWGWAGSFPVLQPSGAPPPHLPRHALPGSWCAPRLLLTLFRVASLLCAPDGDTTSEQGEAETGYTLSSFTSELPCPPRPGPGSPPHSPAPIWPPQAPGAPPPRPGLGARAAHYHFIIL